MIHLREIMLANLYLAVVWIFYDLVLRHSRTFTINRFYLLAGSLVAVVLPWLPLQIPMPALPGFLLGHNQAGGAISAGVPVLQGVGTASGILEPGPVFYIYLLIIGSAISFSVVQLLRLLILVYTRPVHQWGSQRVVEVNRKWTAFSFFGIIFYPEPFDRESGTVQTILAHEMVHARQLHSLDNLFMLALRILFFYNPAAHLLAARARLNHEFIADEVTAGPNPAGYSQTLISHQFLVPRLALTHTFNSKSLLNKRLAMLLTRNSNRRSGWRYLLALPVVFFMVLITGWTAPAQDQNKQQKAAVTGKEVPEVMPKFEGEESAKFQEWVQKNIRFPKESADRKAVGVVYASFLIDETGQLTDTKIVRVKVGKDGIDKITEVQAGNPDGDLFSKEVLRVFATSPKWTPATKQGKAVSARLVVPVAFTWDYKRISFTAPKKAPAQDKVETMPTFQGQGAEAFGNWVASNVKYPQDAIEAKKTGKVFVSYTISQTGEVINVKVERSLFPSCDQEAVRVIKSSPKWTPAISGGKPVDMTFNMPVNFVLN